MKIELRKIVVNEKFSEETTMFRANIYVDGKLVGECNNDGHGGCTFCRPYSPQTKKQFEELEEYCKTLPPIVYPPSGGMGEFTIDCNLEHLVDKLLDEYLTKKDKEKFLKKMEKDMLRGLILSVSEKQYTLVSWKNYTIQQILNTPIGRDLLKNNIIKYKREGYEILNTNIPQELLNQ